MTLEYFRQIKEQEELADKIRHDGLSESKRLVNAANDDAAALIINARSEAEAQYREALARAEEDAHLEYERIINNVKQECDLFMEEAERHQALAVSLIVKRIVT